jgi:hypothetical protein
MPKRRTVSASPDRHGSQYGQKFFVLKGNRLIGGELTRKEYVCRVLLCRTLRRRRSGMACPRCQTSMREIMRIAPLKDAPGLIAYECPACEKLTREI